MTILLSAAVRAALRFFVPSTVPAMRDNGRWVRAVAAATIAVAGPVSALAPAP